jgi:hypothetical protein
MDVTRQILECIITKRDTLKCYYINEDAQGLVYEIIMGQRQEYGDLVETLKGCIKCIVWTPKRNSSADAQTDCTSTGSTCRTTIR